jgi:hypothetical protein
MILVCKHAEFKNCGVIEASIQILREGLGSQAMCGTVRIHEGSPLEGDT